MAGSDTLIINTTKMKLISVEGNVGAGKTSLLESIRDSLSRTDAAAVDVLLEPVEEWTAAIPDARYGASTSMLGALYSDPHNSAQAFQVYALMTRVGQLLDAFSGSDSGKVTLMERSLEANKMVFAKRLRQKGLMNDASWHCYNTSYDVAQRIVRREVPAAEASIVYLRVDPDVCMGRIAKRGRAEEQKLTCEFVADLHTRHEDMIRTLKAAGARVLVVDGNGPPQTPEQVRAIVEFCMGE